MFAFISGFISHTVSSNQWSDKGISFLSAERLFEDNVRISLRADLDALGAARRRQHFQGFSGEVVFDRIAEYLPVVNDQKCFLARVCHSRPPVS